VSVPGLVSAGLYRVRVPAGVEWPVAVGTVALCYCYASGDQVRLGMCVNHRPGA